ncbi:class I SAM-dependent methyltransferase, partial [Thermodesulfobacteriota bacterium]
MEVENKTTKEYWDNIWESIPIQQAVNPRSRRLKDYVNLRFHEYFSRIFSSMDIKGKRLLEIGCARSQWLPYFAKEFGFEVYGIDYSEIGCEQAKQILLNSGAKGEVIIADFFSPPEKLLESFDVVVSFGVIEHFANTRSCIKAFYNFLKPEGIMINSIPNLTRLNGITFKMLNRPLYDMHYVLDKERMQMLHEAAGLEILECNYFVFSNFSVLNLNGLR